MVYRLTKKFNAYKNDCCKGIYAKGISVLKRGQMNSKEYFPSKKKKKSLKSLLKRILTFNFKKPHRQKFSESEKPPV